MSGALSNFVIKETKFNRYISHDIRGYNKYLQQGGAGLYSESEIKDLVKAGVSSRLPPRATKHYMSLARTSDAITNLIKARPEETEDLSGERDPSNQLKYSPVSGLLHKYELILLYVVRTCSSWCRYCYRSDFLTNKTEKDIADVNEVAGYIREYNAKAEKAKAENPATEIFPIKEALLSGGDPMVLSNNNLFDYLHGLAEAGLKTIRIGTKELAFFPFRFDNNFLEMLDLFHSMHPSVNLAFMVHFTHPDEILLKDPKTRKYIKDENGNYKRIAVTESAIRNLKSRPFITMENQTPIIDGVNDNSDALRLLQVEMKRLGINNHYFFQCREIEGHKAFAVPVEKAWKLHKDSQKGLSGIEKSRYAMSTEAGKLEVVSIIEKPDFKSMGIDLPEAAQGFIDSLVGDGLIVMKSHRTPYTDMQGDLIIARRNPNALWITGYEDRLIYDARKKNGRQYEPLAAMVKGFLENYSNNPTLMNSIDEFGLLDKAVA